MLLHYIAIEYKENYLCWAEAGEKVAIVLLHHTDSPIKHVHPWAQRVFNICLKFQILICVALFIAKSSCYQVLVCAVVIDR